MAHVNKNIFKYLALAAITIDGITALFLAFLLGSSVFGAAVKNPIDEFFKRMNLPEDCVYYPQYLVYFIYNNTLAFGVCGVIVAVGLGFASFSVAFGSLKFGVCRCNFANVFHGVLVFLSFLIPALYHEHIYIVQCGTNWFLFLMFYRFYVCFVVLQYNAPDGENPNHEHSCGRSITDPLNPLEGREN